MNKKTAIDWLAVAPGQALGVAQGAVIDTFSAGNFAGNPVGWAGFAETFALTNAFAPAAAPARSSSGGGPAHAALQPLVSSPDGLSLGATASARFAPMTNAPNPTVAPAGTAASGGLGNAGHQDGGAAGSLDGTPISLPPAGPATSPTAPEAIAFATSASGSTGGAPAPTGAATSNVFVESAGGIVFDLIFDAAAMAAPLAFQTGIEQAALALSQIFSNKITLNINIDYSGTGGGAAAGPDSGYYESYSSVRSALIAGAAPGETIFNSLPNATSVQGQSSVAVWNAEMKLFGWLGANDTTTDDGSATFATDINPSLLEGVALHELTHAMGRIPYGTAPDIFDLFRFTSPGVMLFSGGIPAPAAYFSVDGGVTKKADYGENSDPSDFLNSGVQGPNDPFNEYYSGGTLQQLTAVDLLQMQAVGFDLAATSSGSPLSIHLVSDTGASSTDNVTSNDALTGGAGANAVVTLTEGATTLGTATANGSGVWTFTPTGLANGAQTIVASGKDGSGNAATASLTFTLDTVAPAVTLKLVSDTGVSSTDKITSNDALTGGGDPNAVVTLKEGATTLGTASANASGVWTFTPTGLANGAQTIVASETDLAGNVGTASLTFTLDTVAPAVTMKLVSDTGASSTDKITSNDALTGGGDANAVVTLKEGTTTLGTATANGSGVWTFTPTGLANGTQTIVASETDLAGNVGSASLTFTLDTVAPIPTIASEALSIGKVVLTGSTGEANDTVAIYDGASLLGSVKSGSGGAWSYTTGKVSKTIVHTYTTTATDLAGNVGHGRNEAILGSSGADTLVGSAGADIIMGNGGNDTITGGLGADRLTGGSGDVTFDYVTASDSTPGGADLITDFSAARDVLNFTSIAGLMSSGGHALYEGHLSGTGNLTLNAGSVAYFEVNGLTDVLANTTGAAEIVTSANLSAANMEISLSGTGLGLTGANFRHA